MPLSDLSEALRTALPAMPDFPEARAALSELADELAEFAVPRPGSAEPLRHAPSLNDFSMGVGVELEAQEEAVVARSAALRADPTELRKLHALLKDTHKNLHKVSGSFEEKFLAVEAAVRALDEAEAAHAAGHTHRLSASAPAVSLLPKAAQASALRCVSRACCGCLKRLAWALTRRYVRTGGARRRRWTYARLHAAVQPAEAAAGKEREEQPHTTRLD